MNHSDEVVVMANGRVVLKGPPEEVRTDERVIDAYLGGGPARAEEAEAWPRTRHELPGGEGSERWP